MSMFKQFLEKLFSPADPQQQADEAYLAQAVDVCDLERRMQDIEHRGMQFDGMPVHPAHAGAQIWQSPW